MTWTLWLSGGLEPGGRGSSSVQDSSSVFKTLNFLNFALNFYIHIHVWGELASHKRSLTHPPTPPPPSIYQGWAFRCIFVYVGYSYMVGWVT